MSGNIGYQILRGSETYDPSTSEEVLLDGQLFYSKKTKELFVGDGESTLALLKGTQIGLSLENAEGVDSIVMKYSGPVDDSHYGNTNKGESAVVFGEANYNSANRALLAGKLNVNSGANSVLLGLKNKNTASSSLVLGGDNINEGAQSLVSGIANSNKGVGNIISGTNNKFLTANSSYNILTGYSIWVTGENNSVSGQGHVVTGSDNIVGAAHNTIAGGTRNLVAGSSNEVTGAENGVVGNSNKLSGDRHLVAGYNNTVSGQGNIVSGSGNTIDAWNSVYVGNGGGIKGDSVITASAGFNYGSVKANYAFAANWSTVSHKYAAGFGQETRTGTNYQLVTGICNIGKNNTLFEVGNGTSDSDRKNAFEVLKDGRAKSYVDIKTITLEDNDLVPVAYMKQYIKEHFTELMNEYLAENNTTY